MSDHNEEPEINNHYTAIILPDDIYENTSFENPYEGVERSYEDFYEEEPESEIEEPKPEPEINNHYTAIILPDDVYENTSFENPYEGIERTYEDFYEEEPDPEETGVNEYYTIRIDDEVIEILETKYKNEDDSYTLNSFKSKPDDIVRIFRLDEEIINADIQYLTDLLADLNTIQENYINTKNTLNENLVDATDLITLKETEIQEFEDLNKTPPEDNPEGTPYFDADRLDSETRQEYDVLLNDLVILNDNKSYIVHQLIENEHTNNEYDIIETTTSLNELQNIYEIEKLPGIRIPFKYFKEEDSNEYLTTNILSGSYVSIEIVEINPDKDFSDNEFGNTPYYYFVGDIVNLEFEGTSQPCIVFKDMGRYDELKSYQDLNTYYEYERVFILSADIKSHINSLRIEEDNTIPEDNRNLLLDNKQTIIPLTETAEILVHDTNSLSPSLTVLLQIESEIEEPEEPIEQPEIPEPDPYEDYELYLRGGDLHIINGIIFVIPKDSHAVKRIVYVNGFYYILMKNCYIYKLDDDFNIVTTIDLGKISTNIDKTDIFSIGNMLIIKSNKTYVTDLESVKHNYGITNSDVVIDSIKVNTKTIVKVLLK